MNKTYEIQPMKAITVWQPWATLLACGAKKYETRSWPTKYRGPIAIHAAKKNPMSLKDILYGDTAMKMHYILAREFGSSQGDWDDLPLGAIIATAELANCWYIVAHPGTNVDIAKHIPIGVESMSTDKHAPDFADYFVPTEQEIIFGDWTPGRYAWEIANVKMLPDPISVKGMQGLWNWEGKA